MPSRRSILTSATALTALTIAAPTTAWADEPLPVVATFSILGDMVAEIGGEHIALTTLVGSDGDAHVYQPTPQDARAVSEAAVLFMNGLEFEGWLERLVEAASFGGELVVATNGIEPIEFGEDDDHHDDHDEHGDDEHDHDDHDDHGDDKDHDHDDHDHDDHGEDKDHDHDEHGHDEAKDDDHDHDEHDHDEDKDHDHGGHAGHEHGEFDPHAWQSLDAAIIYADNIAAGLAKVDPDNAGDYYANRATYVQKIEALEEEIHALMDGIPLDRRTVVTTHDAFGYFAGEYGITFEAPQGLSTESEASAADVAKLIEQIREEGISAVFVESIADNRLLEQIASETDARIGGTLYSDALSGPDGLAATYIDMMRHNATTLADALTD